MAPASRRARHDCASAIDLGGARHSSRRMRTPFRALCALAPLALAACATTTTQTGFLSSYQGLAPVEDPSGAVVLQRAEPAAVSALAAVRVEPTIVKPAVLDGRVNAANAAVVAAEIDRQLCLELSERVPVVTESGPGVATVRAAVTAIQPTGAVASVLSAAASQAIPGPGSVRAPVGLGGLSAELEAVDGVTGAQIAALAWSRRARVVMDNGSLSAIGDAWALAEPFADAAGRLVDTAGRPPRDADVRRADCARFPGPSIASRASEIAFGLRAPPSAAPAAPAVAPAPPSATSSAGEAAPSS